MHLPCCMQDCIASCNCIYHPQKTYQISKTVLKTAWWENRQVCAWVLGEWLEFQSFDFFTEQHSFAIVSECMCICQIACWIALHHAIAYAMPKKLIKFQKPCAKRHGAKRDKCSHVCWVNGGNFIVLPFSLNNLAMLLYQSVYAFARLHAG